MTDAAGPTGANAARAKAFTALVDRQLPDSYRLAAVLLENDADAADAVQDAIVIAWERFRSLRNPNAFDSWFQRIVINRCIDRLRKRRRVREIPFNSVQLARAPDQLDDVAQRDRLRQAIKDLSPNHRSVVVLRFFADLTAEEIANQTRERVGTIKSRLHYALRSLRAAYDAAARHDQEEPR